MRSSLSARAFLLRCRQPHSSLLQRHLRICSFHTTSCRLAIKTQRLTDIGEGNKEVQIIQWYVSEGARVEEWDNLCQVQSDKAADDITARFGGVIKKIHWEPDDTVQTGEPLVDIDVVGEGNNTETKSEPASEIKAEEGEASQQISKEGPLYTGTDSVSNRQKSEPRGKHSTLATPAVRGLLKEHDLDITSIRGTGRDGRVLKEDVYQFLKSRETSTTSPSSPPPSQQSAPDAVPPTPAEETTVPMTPIQAAMYRSMTASNSIPHFLFTSEVDITNLTGFRQRLNATATASSAPNEDRIKLTLLPFILKALSNVINHYPILNARLSISSSSQPHLIMRPTHNIGVAMDTPQGLLVPVIPSAASHSILSLATQISHLSALGAASKFSSSHLTGGTITVSNIGALGGTVVAPRIVEGQSVIVGVGRSRGVPLFRSEIEAEKKSEALRREEEMDEVVRREIVTLSWAADHRVVDGATVARAAGKVKEYLEDYGRMLVELR